MLWAQELCCQSAPALSMPLPTAREILQRKIDEMGGRLDTYRRKRLQGRPQFKFRAGMLACSMI
jgi:hypothetical protein